MGHVKRCKFCRIMCIGELMLKEGDSSRNRGLLTSVETVNVNKRVGWLLNFGELDKGTFGLIDDV